MTEKASFQERIESDQSLLIAEISPPASGDGALVRAVAKQYAGKVHAVGISDNREQVCLSALAAAAIVASEGIEPILHVVTRDRNRVALVSECFGAQALGVRNVLCTSGTHQTLGEFQAARNVFDIDSIQLLQICAQLKTNGSAAGDNGIGKNGAFCLGGTAAPYADPMELQVMRLAKKVAAGARFLITQPIFETDRFDAWWHEVTGRKLHERCAFVAGIRILTDGSKAQRYAERRPLPMVPDTILDRIRSKTDKSSQRAEGIAIAVETINRLRAVDGLRGFEICSDEDDAAAILEVIETSGLASLTAQT